MIVISKGVVDEIVERHGLVEDKPDRALAIFEYETPTDRKLWRIAFTRSEADELVAKEGVKKLWDREDCAIARPTQLELEPTESDDPFERLFAELPRYGWPYLRPQVKAWSVMVETKMRKGADKLRHLSDLDDDLLDAWIEAEAGGATGDRSAAEVVNASLNVCLAALLKMDRVLNRSNGDTRRNGAVAPEGGEPSPA